MRVLTIAMSTLLSCAMLPSQEVADADLSGRIAHVVQLARETNDSALMSQAASLKGRRQGDQNLAELRRLEAALGIGDEGRTMFGQPVYVAVPAAAPRLKLAQAQLQAAMASGDRMSVAAAAAALREAFGDQAGLPDLRRRGVVDPHGSLDELAAYAYVRGEFTKSSRHRRALMAGRAEPGVRVRVYAEMLQSLCAMHEAAQARAPGDLDTTDRLLAGAATILLALQQPDGGMPFPDLRGENVRFGDIIDQELAGQAGVEVKDGWVIGRLSNGGSYFDTGLAGQALLRAGALLGRDAWTSAGMRAAGFCADGPLSSNWNYNAFAGGLCADAYRIGADDRMLSAAVRFLAVGVVPGQLRDGPRAGRWMDPHNARSVYHLIMLRGLHDGIQAIPLTHPDRPAIEDAARLAASAICDEQDASGVVLISLHELRRNGLLVTRPDRRLAATIARQEAAAMDHASETQVVSASLLDMAWSAIDRRGPSTGP